MVQRRMATKESVSPDGRTLIGRGYEFLSDEGAVLRGPSLRPGTATEVAVVSVHPAGPEDREALKQRTFGVDLPVTLVVEDDGSVTLHDAEGSVRAGQVVEGSAEATAELLRSEPHRTAWICWEWLAEDGRSSVDVALTESEERPRPLEPPTVSTAGVEDTPSRLADRRMWVAVAAVLALIVVAFAACG